MTDVPVAVVDANVLHAMPVCDTLLRLADAGAFRPAWSAQILDEVDSSLTRRGFPTGSVVRRRGAIEAAFPEAMHRTSRRWLGRVPGNVAVSDRHVVATALAASARLVVTLNVKDFPAAALRALGIDVVSPDALLVSIVESEPGLVVEALTEQAAALQSPPMTVERLLELLRVVVPRFAERMSGMV